MRRAPSEAGARGFSPAAVWSQLIQAGASENLARASWEPWDFPYTSERFRSFSLPLSQASGLPFILPHGSHSCLLYTMRGKPSQVTPQECGWFRDTQAGQPLPTLSSASEGMDGRLATRVKSLRPETWQDLPSAIGQARIRMNL